MNGNQAATMQVYPADERLTEIVRHMYCIRQPVNASVVQQQLIPNYEIMLVFNFGPVITAWVGEYTIRIEQLTVLGPLTKLLRYEVPPHADVLVVVFTLNGFYRLVGESISLLRQKANVGPLLRLTDRSFEELWESLQALSATADRLELLNAYLLLRITPTDEVVQSMLDGVRLFNHPAIDPVKAIAETRQLSTRSIQTRFQTNLGFSAKELTRFLRFKKLVEGLVEQYPTPPDWAELVFVHGYHDQPHLNRDFQQFMGLSPTEFVQQLSAQDICITQPGKHY